MVPSDLGAPRSEREVVQGTVARSFPLPYPALTDGAIHCRAFGFGRTRQKLRQETATAIAGKQTTEVARNSSVRRPALLRFDPADGLRAFPGGAADSVKFLEFLAGP